MYVKVNWAQTLKIGFVNKGGYFVFAIYRLVSIKTSNMFSLTVTISGYLWRIGSFDAVESRYGKNKFHIVRFHPLCIHTQILGERLKH